MLSNQIPVKISVVPLYNEEENIDALFQQHTSYEIICINDDSHDNTLKNLVEYHQLYPQIKIDGITSFSFLPLKVWTYVGLIIALVSLVYASFLMLRTIILGIDVPGYASLMVAVLFLGGIQLLTLGIIGEYIGRVYEEVKGQPLYLVRDCYGFENREQLSDKITQD